MVRHSIIHHSGTGRAGTLQVARDVPAGSLPAIREALELCAPLGLHTT